MLQIKRAYDMSNKNDGYRILIDKLWPRGMSKEKEHLNYWAKEITPTTELRQAFDHKAEKFAWFKEEYIKELNANPKTEDFINLIKRELPKHNVTLLYGAKDPEVNHAVILRDFILKKLN